MKLLALSCLAFLGQSAVLRSQANLHTNSNSTQVPFNSTFLLEKMSSEMQAEALAQLDINGISTSHTATSYGCPDGYFYAPLKYTKENKQTLCNKLGSWDIVRLESGGSLSGPGYNCDYKTVDQRSLGAALCVQWSTAVDYKDSSSSTCPDGYDYLSYNEANSKSGTVCPKLGDWDIAYINGGLGSMDGPGYNCKVRQTETRSLGNAACVKKTATDIKENNTNNDNAACGANKSLISPAEAKANKAALCSKLSAWGIYRLAGGGSMDGPSYGCNIILNDPRGLGDAICANAAETR